LQGRSLDLVHLWCVISQCQQHDTEAVKVHGQG
jgi:hypothetical protein